MFGVDKFPRMTDYVVPSGVRIAHADRVRLGAHLAAGTTVMHEGFCNYNAGTVGTSMVEGRISQGVIVGDGSDVGGGASIMGTLSGGGKEQVTIGAHCLLGANSGVGISLGDDCVVEAGLYLTAGHQADPQGRRRRAGGQGPRAVRGRRAAVPAELADRRGRGGAPVRQLGRAERGAARPVAADARRVPPVRGRPVRNTHLVPTRTRRRASPRPAPVVHQDMYTEEALHERPERHRRPPSGARPTARRSRTATAGTAPKPARPAATAGRRRRAEHQPADGPEHDGPEHPLLAPPRPAPRRPGLIPTDIADTIGPVLGKAIADIKAHEDGSRRGGDIEDVHKMRVATRRVRAYLKAARPALDRVATDRLRDDVRELAGTLGVIRDNDVMIHRLHIEAGRLGDPDTGALEHLITRLDTERIAGRDQLISELDDPSYGALLTELDEAAHQPPVADPWADLHELAADEWWTLDKAHRKLHQNFGKNPPNDELHELRIYGKRARYAAELLHDKGAVSEFLEALAAFQEVLGDHQDACVLEDKLRAAGRRIR